MIDTTVVRIRKKQKLNDYIQNTKKKYEMGELQLQN